VPQQIDHIVIISPDLDTAVAKATHAGFTVVRGGVHADGLTHNALIAFTDGSYIELISPTRPDVVGEHRWFARLRHGGGLVDYCLLGDALREETEAIRERGVDFPEPRPLGRDRPDGVHIDWILSAPPGNVGATGWPFLIEDVTPRDLRVPHDPAQTAHANGVTGIAGITVLVRDLDRSCREYEAILGTDARPITSPLGGSDRAVYLPVGTAGTQWIALVQPIGGELAWRVEALGQGPYLATLRTHEGAIAPDAGTPLDPPLDRGALLRLA